MGGKTEFARVGDEGDEGADAKVVERVPMRMAVVSLILLRLDGVCDMIVKCSFVAERWAMQWWRVWLASTRLFLIKGSKKLRSHVDDVVDPGTWIR